MLRRQVSDGFRVPEGIRLYDAGIGHYTSKSCGKNTLARAIGAHGYKRGTYELKFCPQIPWRVVLNEAVELCKMFGAEDAHKYINGVLDTIAAESRRVEIAGNPTVNI